MPFACPRPLNQSCDTPPNWATPRLHVAASARQHRRPSMWSCLTCAHASNRLLQVLPQMRVLMPTPTCGTDVGAHTMFNCCKTYPSWRGVAVLQFTCSSIHCATIVAAVIALGEAFSTACPQKADAKSWHCCIQAATGTCLAKAHRPVLVPHTSSHLWIADPACQPQQTQLAVFRQILILCYQL